MAGKALRRVGRIFSKTCTFLGFFTLMVLIGFFLVNRLKAPRAIPEKAVLTLSLETPFTEGLSPHLLHFLEGGSESFYKLLTTLEKAKSDAKILGIYVNTGTPSLGLAQIQELRERFLALRKAGKFVYFYTPTFGEMRPTPAFYYLATSADLIGLQPLGSVGLTGLGAEVPFLKKAMNMVGVTADFIRHGKYKSYTETFTEEKMSADFRASLETLLDSLGQQLLAGLTEDRKIPLEKAQALTRGGPFSDKEAQKNGLIDRVVYEAAFEEEVLKKAGEGAALVPFAAYQKTLEAAEKTSKSPDIALVFAEGTIVPDREKGSGGGITLPSPEQIGDLTTLKIFREIEKTPTIKAVVYRIDSGGGHALASDAIREGLNKLRRSGKKVIVSMGNTAASGGYLIALGADEIIADAGTITGSIGAFWGKFTLENLWDKWGVYWDHVETAPNALMSSMNVPFSEETRQKLQTWVDDLYLFFVECTAQARHLPLEEAKRLAEGRVWTGVQAQQYKLVDHLGGLLTALERARVVAGLPEGATIGVYPPAKSLWDLVLSSFVEPDGPGLFVLAGIWLKKAFWHVQSALWGKGQGHLYDAPLKFQ